MPRATCFSTCDKVRGRYCAEAETPQLIHTWVTAFAACTMPGTTMIQWKMSMRLYTNLALRTPTRMRLRTLLLQTQKVRRRYCAEIFQKMMRSGGGFSKIRYHAALGALREHLVQVSLYVQDPLRIRGIADLHVERFASLVMNIPPDCPLPPDKLQSDFRYGLDLMNLTRLAMSAYTPCSRRYLACSFRGVNLST